MKEMSAKLAALLLLAATLLIAIGMARSVVEDRLAYRAEARKNAVHSLGGPQAIAAGILALPYVESWDEAPAKSGELPQRRSEPGVHYVLPESLELDGQLVPDRRRLGVFSVNGYTFAGTLKGQLRMPGVAAVARRHEGTDIRFADTPKLIVAVEESRGLRALGLRLDGTVLPLAPGTGLRGFVQGVSASLAAMPAEGTPLHFEVAVESSGAERFAMLPIGLENRIALRSTWPHPSFVGDFLPAEREVRQSGFEAQWRTTAVSSKARTQWLARADLGPAGPLAGIEHIGVALIDPVDLYVMSDRATKYATLIVGCTLALLAVYALLRRVRAHPVHFLLTGLALVLFFLLMLALSERIGFGGAYALAAAACVGLIAYYLGAALLGWFAGVGVAAMLGTLYAALYGILASEQNALLLGTLLAFGALAAVMVASRKVDWSSLVAPSRPAQDLRPGDA